MRKYLLLLIPVIAFSSCRNNNSVSISGKITNSTRDYIVINKIDVNKTDFIDSVKISKKGNFKTEIAAAEPDFYQAGFSSENFVTLLAAPGERITLSFPGEELYKSYTVQGSEGSSLVRDLDLRLLETRRRLDSLDLLYRNASSESGVASTREALSDKALEIAKEQRKFNIEFIINNVKSLAIIKALYQKLNDQTYVLYDQRDLQYLKIASDTLKKYYPESRHTRLLIKTFEDGMRQFNALKLNQLIEEIPEVKLDPVLKDINGKTVALSSLRGRYVLLAFWVSESRECVTENLQLKEFYRLYNRKGFEIYQISLDGDADKWRTAVKFDELPWINTREEDPANPRNAILFNVKSVPANYLFDPQGNIIATNLHGKALQLKLMQLFNK